MNFIDRAWQTARRHLLPADASPQDVQDVRRVFFMGAYTLYQLHQAGEELNAVDSAVLHDALKHELLMFKATVGTELEAKV
jgi:hypothetical protein